MILGPAMCGALLIGIYAEAKMRPTAASAEPYHAAAKAAIESIPQTVGTWSSRTAKEPEEAIKLLRPNKILCLQYFDNDTTKQFWQSRTATLLVVQCKEANDMSGHWPPNCYVNSGEEKIYEKPCDWTVGGLTIPGVEYHFQKITATRSQRTAVYNFLIVPGTGILRDMDGVRAAAGDYQRHYFGAAQFQLVMDADLPENVRSEIFQTLMEPCVPVIETLMMSGGKQ